MPIDVQTILSSSLPPGPQGPQGPQGPTTFTTSVSTTATSVTPNASFDMYSFTSLSTALTINAPTSGNIDGRKLMFRFLDNGSAQSLSWNPTYTVIGVTLPTTTTINKTTYVGCIYNNNNVRWDVIAVSTQV